MYTDYGEKQRLDQKILQNLSMARHEFSQPLPLGGRVDITVEGETSMAERILSALTHALRRELEVYRHLADYEAREARARGCSGCGD